MGGITNYKLIIIGLVVVGMLVEGGESMMRCGEMVRCLAPCLDYLKHGGLPSPQCCQGVDTVNNQAQTREDRQQTCKCLQAASARISRIDPTYANSLPSNCGLKVPYTMSASTNCDSID